jgi:hypothetical protein
MAELKLNSDESLRKLAQLARSTAASTWFGTSASP